ncbi:hypothetical protein [Streptomyces sp. NPDC056188]|uniref:hypothetical protein n=1 Tax=Streptomyces sp. NPDC056188 TaxID=3345740 RepID=UPI0035D72666
MPASRAAPGRVRHSSSHPAITSSGTATAQSWSRTEAGAWRARVCGPMPISTSPPSSPPPRHGLVRARHEGGLWLRTLVASWVSLAVLRAAILYAGDPSATEPLRSWQGTTLRIAGIHGLIALSYLLFPRKAPAGPDRPDEGRTPARR